MAKSDFIFEKGKAIDVGSHGGHSYVYASGNEVPDRGVSDLVFESGSALGGVAFVEDFEDQDWTDNFSVLRGDWSITSNAYEGSYGAAGRETTDNPDAVLLSNLEVSSLSLKFRYRTMVNTTSKDSEDGDFWFGYTDSNNHMALDVKPRNTDNPVFGLREVSGGSSSFVTSASPDFDRDEWLVLRGEVQSDGDFAFECDHDAGTQRISGNWSPATSDLESGKVGPRAYVSADYDLIEVNKAQGGGALPDVV